MKKRTQSDKVLSNKAFEIASNPKYDGYQRRLASMVFKFFDEKSKGSDIKQNEQLAKELSQLLENFKKENFILPLRTIFGVLI